MTKKNLLPRPFRGVITPLITPLTSNDKLDKKGLDCLLNHIINGGVSGVFILGTTGEGPSLSYKLKHELIFSTCEIINGRIPVFVGITDSSLGESTSLAKIAKQAGANALVAAPPYYFNLDQKEVTEYFTALADELPIPLFLYNLPSQTKILIEPATVIKLSEHPQIIGIKDSSGNAVYLNTLIYNLKAKKDFTILVGPDELLASTVLSGGHGGVNGGSNLFPKLFVELYKAAANGDLGKVLVLQSKVMEHSVKINQIGTHGSSALKGLKTALSLSGFCNCNENTNRPLRPFEGKEKISIENNLKSIKTDYLNEPEI